MNRTPSLPGILLLLLLLSACRPPEAIRTVADRPPDYLTAVQRMVGIHAAIVAQDVPADEAEDVTREWDRLLDWLPWLAADTDLPETPWNRVAATVDRLAEWVDDADGTSTQARLERHRAQAHDWQAALDELRQIATLLEEEASTPETGLTEYPTSPDIAAEPSSAQEDP